MASLSPGLDRTGVVASVFCALHCAAAPVLLVLSPTLGGLWSHPLSHLAIAALVLPVAAMALRGGFRIHGRRGVVVLGGLGIGLVVVGAVLPYVLQPVQSGGGACDQCCPSFVVDAASGTTQLNVPPATIVTLAGGIALIAAHLANLRCCSGCRATATPGS